VSDASGVATVSSWVLGSGVNTLIANLEGATGSPVTFSAFGAAAPPTISVDRTAVILGATSTTLAFQSVTPPTNLFLRQQGTGVVTWTATSNRPWLTLTPSSGTGSGAITIAAQFDPSLPASGTTTGAITIAVTGAANTVPPVNVTLNISSSTAPPSPPFGSFDSPVGDSTVLAGSIGITGWALDNVAVSRVELWRDLQPGETTPPFASTPSDPRNGKIFISNATFVEDSRPDIETLYPALPFNFRGGWGYLLLTWGLWNQGNGTYTLHAFALDQDGSLATLGSKTIVVNNSTATRPFGSIDTPDIGGEASGPNFGWALTPKVAGAATCKIQPGGVQVSIDSGPLQPVVFGDVRTDIAGAFAGFSNAAAAGGHYIFDWSTLTTGAHTIGWLVTDDCNRADGIGSRFFSVTNVTSLTAAATTPGIFAQRAMSETESSDPITVARGYGELPEVVHAGAAGTRTIEIKAGERIEMRTPRGYRTAYQLVAGRQRPLPIGATWDAASGTFYWQPAPGFLGRYRVVFGNGAERISVRLVVLP
jgi:hypothetical protein